MADYLKYVAKLPAVVAGITGIVNLVRNASDADKKDAIRAATLASVSLAEFAVEKDVLNDQTIMKLVDALIDAEAAVIKARTALKEGILNKTKA
jgi:hypothetical protein